MNHPAPPVASHELPPLPAPSYFNQDDGDLFTAEDMRHYARSALAAPVVAPAAPMSEHPNSFHLGSPVPSEDLQTAPHIATAHEFCTLKNFDYAPGIHAMSYMDSINGEQLCRDDLWLATTTGLNAIYKGPPVVGRPPVAPMWQPIETAPKGRKVLAGYPNKLGKWRTVTACYYEAKTLQREDERDADDDEGYAPEGWYEESETQDGILPTDEPPTHWMPLPAPPVGADTEPREVK